MTRELIITEQPIIESDWIKTRTLNPQMGAVVTFTGTVRDLESGKTISSIHYEAFEKMAIHQFHLLFDELEKRWPIASLRLVHRVGLVKAGEPSIWMEIVASHRREAFEAGQWLLTEMKLKVPIWKTPIGEA